MRGGPALVPGDQLRPESRSHSSPEHAQFRLAKRETEPNEWATLVVWPGEPSVSSTFGMLSPISSGLQEEK